MYCVDTRDRLAVETFVPFFVLAVLSISYSTAVRRIERLRRGLALGRIPNVTAVWTVPAAMLLLPGQLAVLIAITYWAEWPSRKVVGAGRPRRYVYSAATVVAAAEAAAEIHRAVGGWLGIAAALVAWQIINPALVAGAMVAHRQSNGNLRQFVVLSSHVFEFGNKMLGVLLFVGLRWHAELAPLAPIALVAWHHWNLRGVRGAVGAVNPATGLYNEDAWFLVAEERRTLATGCAALLMIDAPGQERAVHAVLQQQLRADDPCGHYAGRVVSLVEVDLAAAGRLLVAEVNRSLAMAGLGQCTVGAVTSLGEPLEDMLIRAGEDLMARRARSGEARSAAQP